MRTYLYYDAVKIDGPKKKILEFNETDKFMDDKDLKVFEGLCEALKDKDNFYNTKITDYQQQLMAKLIDLPIAKVFPCLDLYRIFLTHPDATCHFKKYEDGKSRIWVMVRCLNDKEATDPTIMLSLRCLANVFKDMNGQFCFREMRQKVFEAVSSHI